ncbi:GNAT family N-acetyltransferase [Paenibacillus phoenicis]|uniref:GNAT family N-acetyltransferase n=1 Tax=Paenibacillus phoenicis TaxID=554117 RepID=A0ABU5PLP9_9BACL|nr:MULTISPECIES: GNAT family N-acetyltransferase [Paenibacillus]EES72946.1 acetyltransferase, GNAT family [Paenibacillus sp. oral taxon 786 str. D14]MEA3570858.1 GNAT family N-acetyltransferase [Paenibacillus phoenicis]
MTEMKEQLRRQFPVLESERLVLRRLLPEDAEAMFRCMSDPAVRAFTELNPGKLLFPGRLYRYFEESYRVLRDLHFAVIRKAEGDWIGLCSLQHWDVEGQTARLGYLISPAHWNQGYATEAAASVLDFAFETLGLGCVEARCSPDNPASERVLRKCGLREAGRLSPAGRRGRRLALKRYIIEGKSFET